MALAQCDEAIVLCECTLDDPHGIGNSCVQGGGSGEAKVRGLQKKKTIQGTFHLKGGFLMGTRAGRREKFFGISDAIRYCQRASLTVNRSK